MRNLEGKTAVVTGGASGIGLGMARAFAGRGANLVLADLNEELMADAATDLESAGVKVLTMRCDMSDLEQVEELASLAK